MKNFILHLFSLIENVNKCKHKNALLNSNEGYCPDCGKYLKKYYYVLRCSCCSHKREASKGILKGKGEIIPLSRYCPVCGGEEFYVEKYEKLNLVDINYAIEVKEEFSFENAGFEGKSTTTVWVENVEEDNKEPYQRLSLPLNSFSGLLKAGNGLPLT